MTSVFKKPKAQKFEPSKEQKAAELRQTEEAAEQESEISERKAVKKKAQRGRGSLLFSSEMGVTKDTLG